MDKAITQLSALLPSVPYPAQKHGYWLPVTSTINWCEEDYYATEYSAEIVNSFTNLMFFALAVKGLMNCYKQGHDPLFYVTFLGYAATGIGSFWFHTTLKYPWQLVDELSMIYTTSFACYAAFSHRRSAAVSAAIGVFLFALDVFITVYYHFLQDPVFHQRAYAALTAALLLRNMWMMDKSLRPSRRPDARAVAKLPPARRAEREREDRRDLETLNTMWAVIGWGLGVFLGGFAIWALDNRYCSNLRRWRRQLGLPWGVLLEGHGWWHVMTGLGAYYYIVWGIWLRHCLTGRKDEYYLHWPTLLSIAEVRRRPKQPPATEANGQAKEGGMMNGHAAANGHAANGHALNGHAPNGEAKKTR